MGRLLRDQFWTLYLLFLGVLLLLKMRMMNRMGFARRPKTG